MIQYLLDLREDPSFFEKHSSAKWLIIVSVAALVALIVWYVVKKRKQKGA
ncbi:MAG: FeoB-associated Cys-rich membrane protein [Bacteroidetes bacterium]|nr:FeoB-associated Cys-rich membrane protein [Bacteroidota bacterium]